MSEQYVHIIKAKSFFDVLSDEMSPPVSLKLTAGLLILGWRVISPQTCYPQAALLYHLPALDHMEVHICALSYFLQLVEVFVVTRDEIEGARHVHIPPKVSNLKSEIKTDTR